MNPLTFIRLFAEQDSSATGSTSGDPTPASRSLADLIIAFDPSPYLGEPFRQMWVFLRGYPWLFALLLVLTGFSIGWIMKKVIHRLLNLLRDREKAELDYEIIHYLTQPVLQTMVTVSLVVALAALDFPGALEHVLIQVCFTVLLVLWGRAWFRATKVILQAFEAQRHRFHLFQPRTVPLYEMGIKLLLMGLFIYIIFLIWGIDATAWVASAGIIGIVVGFAARDTLANLISGVSIVADAPYKIGDYIVLDSGERGLVVSLGIRSTRILTRDDVEVSIPNALIGSAKIVNESGGPWVRHRIRIPVGVAYDSDIDKVIDVLKDIAHENDHVVDEPASRVRLRGFGNSAIEMELLCWINQPADRGMTVHHLMRAIIKRFREEGIEIPFPQRDVHFKEPRSKAGPQPEAAQTPAES